jgi:hypothetical protein
LFLPSFRPLALKNKKTEHFLYPGGNAHTHGRGEFPALIKGDIPFKCPLKTATNTHQQQHLKKLQPFVAILSVKVHVGKGNILELELELKNLNFRSFGFLKNLAVRTK